MGLFELVFLSFCYISISTKFGEAAIFDVTTFGAKGDGRTYDTKAFIKAWAALCGDTSENPTLIIPRGKTFLLGPVSFNGPCRSPSVSIKLQGDITAPKTLDGWKGCANKEVWIYFMSVNGLTIEGPGKIDGQGAVWWEKKVEKSSNCNRPRALHFNKCNKLQLRGTTHINSPRLHIGVYSCHGVDIGHLHIVAPANSPNTDGVGISESSNVHVHDSRIQTGDDCVAINGGTSDINVTRILCGPGHGISIGSLGQNGDHDTVERVRVVDCNITGTTNGVRIKTVPGGRGHAKNILFQQIQVRNVKNPIIIDQHYCNGPDASEERYCPSPPSTPAVEVSSVRYQNIYGSSASKKVITLDCSRMFNCTNIQMEQVGITKEDGFAYCKNAQGRFIKTIPQVNCD